MKKKALKAFAIFNIVSWYLYGKGDKVEVVFEPVIIGAFRNFKKVFKWMIG